MEQHIKIFALQEFNTKSYSLPNHNCNNFCRYILKFLKPTEQELGLDVLSGILVETAQTVSDIHQKIGETKDAVCDFVEHNAPMIIAGVGIAASSLLSFMTKP